MKKGNKSFNYLFCYDKSDDLVPIGPSAKVLHSTQSCNTVTKLNLWHTT